MSRLAVFTLIVFFVLVDLVTGGPATGTMVDDFEDRDLISASGSAWVPIADDLLGGPTTLRLEAVRGASGSRGALRLTGTIGGEPTDFGGAWTAVAEGGRAADLSAFSGLALRLRGDGPVLIGVRRGPSAKSINFMATVTAGKDWKTVEIPFSSLRPQGKGVENERWDPRDARFLGVQTVPGQAGPFTIEIDDVSWTGAEKPGAAPISDADEPPTNRSLIPDNAAPLRSLSWRELAKDGDGDGRPGLPDARALFVATESGRSLAWFRIDLKDAPPANWIGVNVALDCDADPSNGPAWWGKNTAFHFDRMITAWVFRVADRYEGIVGVASGEDVAAMRMTNQQEVHLAVDRGLRRVYIGVPTSLVEGGGVRAVAAVGSAMIFSDDIPNEGAAILGPAARATRKLK
ncbi:MAG TPA: CIA30 family protein [Candidatus Polarisedimenticolia bacterium]|nr:CIA30 family protein [Candidatus Polarisedimenticolia bacterium]